MGKLAAGAAVILKLIDVTATFPDSNPFGLIVNGEKNNLQLHLNNHSKKNYTLVAGGASYHDVEKHWALVKNTTALKYNVPLVAGANFSAPFQVYSEFKPKELGLTVWADLVETGSGNIQRVTAFNQTVSVVEQQSGFFDVQLIFLYLLLAGLAALAGMTAYNSYFKTAATKRKRGTKKAKAVVVADQDTKAYPDVRPYEEEWIPEQHLKSRGPKAKKGGEPDLTSGGEATSGGETSGAEGKKGKGKGKKSKRA